MTNTIRRIPPPWEPPPYEEADYFALQALVAGKASEAQQKRAMALIVNTISDAYNQSYRPGKKGQRDTDFAEGKRFVGLQIVGLINRKPPEKKPKA